MKIIDQREDTIKILRDMVSDRDGQISMLEEKNLTLIARKNKEEEEYKKVIEEQYKLINDLAKKLNKIK